MTRQSEAVSGLELCKESDPSSDSHGHGFGDFLLYACVGPSFWDDVEVFFDPNLLSQNDGGDGGARGDELGPLPQFLHYAYVCSPFWNDGAAFFDRNLFPQNGGLDSIGGGGGDLGRRQPRDLETSSYVWYFQLEPHLRGGDF